MTEGNARDWKIVAGVSLIQTSLKRLDKIEQKLKLIGTNWDKIGYIDTSNQWEVIFLVGGVGIEGEWFVNSLNRLNAHLKSDNPHEDMVRRLVVYCRSAGLRCLRKYAQLWGDIMRESIVESFKSGYISNRKALPINVQNNEQKSLEDRWSD